MSDINKELDQIFKDLLLILKKATSEEELITDLADFSLEAVLTNFDREGRPSAWESLSEQTIESRKKKGYYPGKILQQTGFLRRSIQRSIISGNKAEVFASAPYAGIHQFGGEVSVSPFKRAAHTRKINGKTVNVKAHEVSGYSYSVPARPFMNIPSQDFEIAQETISNTIGRILDKELKKLN